MQIDILQAYATIADAVHLGRRVDELMYLCMKLEGDRNRAYQFIKDGDLWQQFQEEYEGVTHIDSEDDVNTEYTLDSNAEDENMLPWPFARADDEKEDTQSTQSQSDKDSKEQTDLFEI